VAAGPEARVAAIQSPDPAVEHAMIDPTSALDATTWESSPSTLDDAQRRIEHLEDALETHGRIGQAIGILMSRYTISADAAFSAVSRVSQCHNVKLRTLADAVIATIDDPGMRLPRELADALEELLRVGEGQRG
jgi:hypothetical protein